MEYLWIYYIFTKHSNTWELNTRDIQAKTLDKYYSIICVKQFHWAIKDRKYGYGFVTWEIHEGSVITLYPTTLQKCYFYTLKALDGPLQKIVKQ